MQRDHGGGLDAAIAKYGGSLLNWIDLSTGINPQPYPVGDISSRAWSALPDQGAMDALLQAARRYWKVPDGVEIVAAPGASSLIARLPDLSNGQSVYIPGPTYNEHAASFGMAGRQITDAAEESDIHVYVSPNNPDGRLISDEVIKPRKLTVIDESFCDVTPDASMICHATGPGVVILKSFGKFWGLAGLRLGFAIGAAETLNPSMRPKASNTKRGLTDLLGPWHVSGPAIEIATRALQDVEWAESTRTRLETDSERLDALMQKAGATRLGGTTLFRLYEVDDAQVWQDKLAKGRVWSRIFPYSSTWLRLGLPPADRWQQLEDAL